MRNYLGVRHVLIRCLFYFILFTISLSAVLCFAVDKDFNGIPRAGKYPGDMPDIGAFEFVVGGYESVTGVPSNFKIKSWKLSYQVPDQRGNSVV